MNKENGLSVRVIIRGGGVHDLDFPSVPRIGEAIIIDTNEHPAEIFQVLKVGYRIVHFDRPALAVVECEEFVDDLPSPGTNDRMVGER